ncbi:Polysialic acid transport ATP-binding protein KpsT [Roseovarius sp. EC-HK134]|jgi:capsular polysaccharide transport system ATP-binding protein|uniref:Polysialic acid transport ATP-binding protein KpsT n=1 Tax=Roseovarius mucosus TaxID=215743 RepID=A0A1V0RPT2_9RHOB|nr:MULTISPECIES: ABC transporter ATP-binding protein [Roseovarius]ARE83784.1 polysialic acid transport ATP-binding protein KpsT [Roseovarius mucosus]AWZ19581.1 Capsular polysaccharide ABC transporter, ATP-binding protein KpsT [Roseovarius sp. AK1035]EDM33755.1 putative cell surface polysaccharide export ABC-2 transporter ATP-binding protein [Roseovarius sp. TM1035]MBW4973332.1 ABC transporter ATP-binding protein [Roseovarius mucosus]VVT08438.1 Polysialic acid transport ATP-binding protein KpsT|tara:strand:+ start:466 stop:1140 length:675 start_codon:yes stop_codon:yes gene_type:complete
MIEIRNLCKTFVLNGRRKVVADNISAVFPDRTAVAILGRNGAGKSSLLKMLSGSMDPDSGEVISTGTISWPVGFAGSFHPEMTGLQNVRFIARVYGVDTAELVDFVADFAGLGQHFNLPVRTYSSGMRSRLAFGVSMGIHFETYLVDEVTAVGDAAFREKSELLFAERITQSGAIMVTHNMGQVKRLCSLAGVLEDGHLSLYDDVDAAIAHHQELMKSDKAASG